MTSPASSAPTGALAAAQLGLLDVFDPPPEEAPPLERVCVSCSCWHERACNPPCGWRADYEPHDLPDNRTGDLCSGCAPPLVLVGGIDVDDVLLGHIMDHPGTCPGDLHYSAPLAGLDPDDVSASLARLLADGYLSHDESGGLVYVPGPPRTRGAQRPPRASDGSARKLKTSNAPKGPP